MFTTLIVQPISNLLILILSILPGHNLGLAIIIFTILVRLAMWPLVKRQLHHAKAMRALQPELKKIKKAAAGDKQKEQKMMMELYKEREVNPFAPVLILVVQIPILIGLYSGLKRIISDPHYLITIAYPAVQHLSWIQGLQHNIHTFDATLLGFIDLTRKATGPTGIYFPAFLLAIGSAYGQYLISKQLLPQDKDSRGLRSIMKDARSGKNSDQQEVNAAVGRATLYIIPFFVFIASLNFPAALPLYWLTSSAVAYIQQSRVLNEDVQEAEIIADRPEPKKSKPEPRKKAIKSKSGLKVTRTTIKDPTVKRKRRRK